MTIVIWLLAGLSPVLVTPLAGMLVVLAFGRTAREAPMANDIAVTIEAMTTPVLVLAPDVVIHANAAARELLGSNVVGKKAIDAIPHPAAQAGLSQGYAEAGATTLVGLGRDDQSWDMHIAGGAGSQRVVQLIDQTGGHAAGRMRVDFVANASHELRTPLAAILGFAETLSDVRAELDAATRARFLKVMLDEARRMSRLVEDLISLSRIEAEKHRAPEVTIDLATLAADVRAELVDGRDQRGLDIVMDIAPGVPPVTGDRAQLSQLLHNLLGNAMKYGRPGTPITLSVDTAPDHMVRIAVGDRGEGIAAKHLPRLTERFYRVDSGRSRSLGGTGLGLAIVKHVVERHRGQLDIASSVGEGTEVTVLLPAAVIKA